MSITYKGKVIFAGGDPAVGVQVRLFEPAGSGGASGAELTEQPGSSAADGRFTLQIKDSPYLDTSLLDELNPLSDLFDDIDDRGQSLGDEPRPQFTFETSLQGNPRSFEMPFRKLHRTYSLPVNPPVDFLPSRDGFAFWNSFKFFDPPFSLPDWLGVKRIKGGYGLCGGMSAGAYDFRLARARAADSPDIGKYQAVPKTGTRLHRYLVRRAVDTFGERGGLLVKVADWSLLPDGGSAGVQHLTLGEWEKIKSRLDDGQCVVTTLIYEHAKDRQELKSKIMLNHQVLAYGYAKTGPDKFDIKIYDSNLPKNDGVMLRIEKVQVGEASTPHGNYPIYGLTCREFSQGWINKNVRGFFPMNYEPASPPGG